jgi:hypothetical protein
MSSVVEYFKTNSKSKSLFITINFILFALAFRGIQILIYSLRWPQSLSPDSAQSQLDAWLFLQGQVPYVDFYSINLPMNHLIHAIGIKLFGYDDLGIRLFNILIMSIACAVTAQYLKKYSKLAALISIPLTLRLTIDFGTFGQMQRELFLMPLWIGMMWKAEAINDQKSTRLKDWILFATFCGVACFIKPQSLFFGLLLISYLFIKKFIFKEESFTNLLSRYIIIPLFILMAIIFLIASLPLFLGYSFNYLSLWYRNFQMYSANSAPFSVALIFKFMIQPFTLWPQDFLDNFGGLAVRNGEVVSGTFTLLHLSALGLYLFYVKNKKHSISLILFLMAGFISFILHRRGFAYHLIPMWHAFNMMIAIGVGHVINELSTSHYFNSRKSWQSIGTFLLAISLIVILAVKQYKAEKLVNSSGFGALLKPKKPQDFQVIEYIGDLAKDLSKDRLNKKITIQIIEIHTIALASVLRFNLECATSFMQAEPLYANYAYRDSNRKAFLSQLSKNPPDIFVLEGETLDEKLIPFPELKLFLESSYKLTKKPIDPYWIFSRI